MRSVLYVAATFPPAIGGALARNTDLAGSLAAWGWMPTIVMPRYRAGRWADPTTAGRLAPSTRIVSTGPTYHQFSERAGGAARPTWRQPSRAVFRRLVLSAAIPDVYLPWALFAAVRAAGLVLRRRADAIVSSGPPHSAHVAASMVHTITGAPWIADLTDPWVGAPYEPVLGGWRAAANGMLEAACLRGARYILSATTAQTQMLRARYPHLDADRFRTLPNGYDEHEIEVARAEAIPSDDIIHAGSLHDYRSPTALIRAFGQALTTHPEIIGHRRLRLMGYMDPRTRAVVDRLVDQLGLGSCLDVVDYLPRRDSLRAQAGAAALVIVTDPGFAGRALIPQKTYEYLALGRPVLALAPDGETARLIRQVGGGLVAPPDDPAAIAATLVTLLAAPPPPAPDQALAPYRASNRAAMLAAILNDACPVGDGGPSRPAAVGARRAAGGQVGPRPGGAAVGDSFVPPGTGPRTRR